ncbi:MAG TPA: hypothetical protein PL167_08040 [Cyclobacteriaceae bacterium]|nr:hypothetical protein [Cyclobacteriaceae bacterium]
MDAIPYTGFRNFLIRWVITFTVIAGFFTGYTANATSAVKSKTQTEWVYSKQSLKKVRCVFEKENKILAVLDTFRIQNKVSILQAQNRLTLISFKANHRLMQSITSNINFIHFKHRPQPAEEDSFSA